MITHGLIMNLLIFMALAISLTSCTPADKYMKDANNVSVQSNGADYSSENYRYVSVNVDRAVESLHLLKATLDSSYAAQSGIVLSEDSSGKLISYGDQDGNAVVKTITAGSYKHNLKLKMKVNLSSDANQALANLDLTNSDRSNSEETFYINKNGKINDRNDVSITNINRSIKIQKMTEANHYLVTENNVDEINIFKYNQVVLSSQFQMEIMWDGQTSSLSQSIQVLSMSMVANRIGRTAIANYSSLSSSLTISLNAGCPSVNGQIVFAQAANNQAALQMDYVDSSITYSTGQKPYKATSCGIRPVVDVSRLSSYN